MKKRIIASALALSFAAPCAFAQNASAVRISGFGTGALTWNNTDKAEFARPNQASGATKDVTTGVDSNFGVQADYAVNSWLSVTGQGLVRKDAQDDFGAELAWAFAKAKVSDDVAIRVGRMGVPAFMISDYRNVGYANTMLRPPAEMYSQMLFNTVDGADVTWQHSYGDTTYTAQFAVGKSKVDIAGGPSLDGHRLTALNLVAEHGPLTVRFGRVDGRLTLNGSTSLTTLLNSLNAVGAGYRIPQAAQLASDIDVHDKKASFTSLGATLDWNDVVVQSEYAKRKTDSYINDTTSWYVMGGYRIGKFLPYYSHARLTIDGSVNNGMPAACPAGYPAACTPTLAALSGIVSSLRYTGVSQGEQQTDTIGVRWDFYRSLALKVQFDHVRPNQASGLLINAQPGFHGPVNVGAVALDFVF
ncbi:hypothetical protein [Massilia sp. Root335]|jgi:hypothetical protein|uniref:hypothetical protein n=1 Tax=Massilia sp. Root335 TaxID=1736517 RepID=UPI0006F7ED98|nr:hypothetical protein [Massilia sp. Root335]KQV39399.1 hypothetical protein ASC93_19735 [Massilia sp. Root335]